MNGVQTEGYQSNQTLIKASELRRKLGGVSNMFLWRHVLDGKLPTPIKIGSRRFWFTSEIDSFLAERSAARGPGNG